MAAAASTSGAAASVAGAEAAGLVVAGPTSYHRPSCRLLDGRGALPTISVAQAEEQGLSPCRTCDAADLALPVAERSSDAPKPRRRRTTTA
jgi:hypothetical protein